MPALFPDLRKQLLAYKNANHDTRKKMLKAASDAVNAIKDVKDQKAAAKAYKTMAYASTLIAYANNLHNIDNQEYFSILVDFKMPQIFDKMVKVGNEDTQPFLKLKDYFEFHPSAPKMRLLKPLAEIPNEIWKLFRQAQKAHIVEKGSKGTFNLDELDTDNPPADALYPIRIQFLGKLHNRAVDCITPIFKKVVINGKEIPAGTFKLANKFGRKLLPGGGMQEINSKAARYAFLEKVLDEHLEEERGNLHVLAKTYYDKEIDTNAFDKALNAVYAAYLEKAKTITNADAFFAQLKALIDVKTASNSIKLNTIIQLIDSIPKIILPPSPDGAASDIDQKTYKDARAAKEAQEKTINELRAAVQVQTFKKTSLYQQAFKFLDKNAVIKQVEQFCDERQGGGFQISDVAFINCEPSLFDWFNEKEGFKGVQSEPGDDLRGTNASYETLLQALAAHDPNTHTLSMNFSHILILLQSQLDCFKNGKLKFDQAQWDQQIAGAKQGLLSCAGAISDKVSAAQKTEKARYEQALQELTAKNNKLNIKKKELKSLKGLVKDLHSALKSSENKVDYNTLRVMAQNTTLLLDKKMQLADYKKFTQSCLLGRPANKTLKVIAGILAAIAVAAVVLGALTIASPLGIALVGGGVAGLLGSTGLFAKGRSSGFRSKLADVAESAEQAFKVGR